MLEIQNEFRSSIPVSLDHFVGRIGDFQAALVQLQTGNERWLTITGPGGVGKTRFALELARRLESRFLDGATWVDCADLKTPLEGVQRLLEGLGEQAGANPLRQLERVLRDQECLIVLDNLEQIRGMGKVLESMLGVCVGITVLATSRSPLRSPFERRYPLLPLECPPFEAQTQAAVIFQTEAAQLFLERAGRVEPHFIPSEQEAQLLARLCGLLDGLPLALELAASQMGNYSLRELLERVQAGRALPTSRERGTRQSSLENNLSWGFELLEPSEQALLMRLGLLEGTFQRDLLRAFASENVEGLLDTSLDILVDSGWVKRSEQGFKLLETVRVFALGIAREHTLEQTTMQALFDFLIPSALEAGKKLLTSESALGFEFLERIRFHLYKALEWGLKSGFQSVVIKVFYGTANWILYHSGPQYLSTILHRAILKGGLEAEVEMIGHFNLSSFYLRLGNTDLALKSLEQANSTSNSNSFTESYQATIDGLFANVYIAQCRYELARTFLIRILSLEKYKSDLLCDIRIRLKLGYLLVEMGCFQEAKYYLNGGLELINGKNLFYVRSLLLVPLGVALRYLGEPATGQSLLYESFEFAKSINQPTLMAHAYHRLAFGCLYSNPTHARVLILEALRLKCISNERVQTIDELHLLALLELFEENFAQSKKVFTELLLLVDQVDFFTAMITPLEGLAALELATGDTEQAAKLLGASQRLLEGIAFHRYPEFQEQLKHTKQQLEIQLGADFATHLEQGRTQGHLPLLERYGLRLRYRPAQLSQTLKMEQPSPGQLSPRESEVLALLAQGFTNKQIAAQLQLSSHTIRGFVVGLFNKLYCKTRAQAVSKASKLGLL